MDIFLWLVVIFGYLLSAFLIFKTYVFALSLFHEVPFVASNRKIAHEAIKLLDLQPTDRFIDIGSGDGSVVFQAAKEFDAKSFDGVEYSKALTMQSNIAKIFSKQKSKIQFHNEDAFVYNYSRYNKVFLYMTAEITGKLMNKLKSELPKGSKVVSAVFKMGEFEKDNKVDEHEFKLGNKIIKIYLWEK